MVKIQNGYTRCRKFEDQEVTEEESRLNQFIFILSFSQADLPFKKNRENSFKLFLSLVFSFDILDLVF